MKPLIISHWVSVSEESRMPEAVAASPETEARTKRSVELPQTKRVCLVGGKNLLRVGIAELLQRQGLEVTEQHPFEEHLDRTLAECDELPFDLVVLILSGGPFAAIHRIREALGNTHHSVPLVVISENTGRGQVYAALRIGAKAYLDMDCDPQELIKAIRMAAENKVYLAPDVAELLVSDMSAAFEPNGAQRLPSVDLSRREVEIVQLLCEGLSSKEIARRLHLSAKTVENHRYNIYRKCNVDSVATLMRHAIRHGLISI
jgi:DNA-binding NarL/FixJ family response regulator